MDAVIFVLLVFAVLILLLVMVVKPRRNGRVIAPLPVSYRQLLQEHVAFYSNLDEENKKAFENRLQHFLSSIRITGTGVIVEDLDKVLIGASAIIPIYFFSNWEYTNIREVILYPGTFNEEFETEGQSRSVLGMVGEGALQQVMLLSQVALREGFSNKTGKNNTAIHEFIHLVDKTDGAVDGVPEVLMQHQYTLPWLDMMHKNIKAIQNNQSDINPYGATNQAEFLAVVSEYFFERPDLLKIKHPDLYDMLEKIFGKR
ncbi:MAG: zinc-dependent peptidase [Chitinophagaceae bacterium]|nr:zinc-dependent peptidase [Chitinophagaceae bacterium]